MLRLLIILPAIFMSGCSTLTCVDDLQRVFGPRGVAFAEREFSLDLNGDGSGERVVFFANKLRGLDLPRNVSELSEGGGVIVDGFAVFDGVRPTVPVFYQYREGGGYQLRLDIIDGQRLLVSDSDRDYVQHVWGWWRYPDTWPPTGWEARDRPWDEKKEAYGAWNDVQRIAIHVGKL